MINLYYVFAVVSAAGGSAFNHGFHSSLFNTLSDVILTWYQDVMWDRESMDEGFYDVSVMEPFIVSSFPLGGFFGSFFIWPICFMGRKIPIIITSVITIVGVILQNISYAVASYEVLIIGRFFVGFSAGLTSGVTMLYIVEISPYYVRGTAGVFYSVLVALASNLAYVVGVGGTLGQDATWQFSFVLCYIPAVCQIVSMAFCPESPKYLYFDLHDEEEGETILTLIRDGEIDDELEDYMEEATALEEIGEVNCQRIFSDQTLSSPMIISVLILFAQQVGGIDVILYFSSQFLQSLGYSEVKSASCSLGLSFMMLLANIISMFLVDRIGRRSLVLLSLGSMIVCLLVITLLAIFANYLETPNTMTEMIILFMFFYVFVYGLGLCTIPALYAAELNNQFARPIVMCIGMIINWFMQFLVVAFFAPFQNIIGNYIFLIYFGIDILMIICIYFTMRETLGMETVDIIDLFYD